MSVARAGTTENYTISIIDSTKTGTDAATVSSTNPANPNPISVSSGTLLTYTSGSPIPLIPVHKTKTEFFSNTDPWIRTNTLADIDLMTERISDANPPTRIVDELTVTIPTDTTILNQLTNTALVAGDTDDLAIVTNIAAGTFADTAYEHLKNKGKQIGCKRKGERYWTSKDDCRARDLIAFADYTTSTNPAGANTQTTSAAPLYLSGTSLVDTGNSEHTSDGQKITGVQYLSYPIDGLSLASKKIKITVNTLPSNANSTLVDFGTVGRIKKAGGGYQCTWLNPVTDCVTTDGKILSFIVPTTIGVFTIGNNSTLIGGNQYNSPIGVTIQKIQISNFY